MGWVGFAAQPQTPSRAWLKEREQWQGLHLSLTSRQRLDLLLVLQDCVV